jgi:hypothetical protein
VPIETRLESCFKGVPLEDWKKDKEALRKLWP